MPRYSIFESTENNCLTVKIEHRRQVDGATIFKGYHPVGWSREQVETELRKIIDIPFTGRFEDFTSSTFEYIRYNN